MQNQIGKLDRLVDGVGWGLFVILIGILFLAQGQGWLVGNGWLYFAIGLGSLLTIEGIVTFFAGNRSRSVGRLVFGLALLYVGFAFLYGFGDWWALVLIPIGVSFLVKAVWGQKKSMSNNTGASI
jgi:hypothetical protein